MEAAVAALKGAMRNNPSQDIQDLGKDEDIFDHYNPHDCLHYRKEKVLIAGEEKIVRRVYYYKAGYSSAYCNVGWVLNSDCDVCLKCNNMFGMFDKKHHCRVCGDIVCSECSLNRVLISEFRDYGAVRVCDQCFFGQEEISVKKEEHVMDILKRAEEHVISQRDRIEEDVVEIAGWQADYQEVERVAREKAAQYARIAAETAALRSSMISSAANTSSPTCRQQQSSMSGDGSQIFVYQEMPQLSLPSPSEPGVIIYETPPSLLAIPVICNHELNVLRDLEVIEKRAVRDMNKYLNEAEGAAMMQQELAEKVRELEYQVQECDMAVSTTNHLKEDVQSNEEQERLSNCERLSDFRNEFKETEEQTVGDL